MKTKHVIFFVLTLAALVIILWPHNLKIKEVYSGNSVLLDNGAVVNLIGVCDSAKAQKYIDDFYYLVDVSLICDESFPFNPRHLRKGDVVYAYVCVEKTGQCINSEIIKLGLADLDENNYLKDSLRQYRRYASAVEK